MAKSNLESLMVNLCEKVDNQYSDLDKRLDNIEKVMIAQQINLNEHMKRSDHLEEIVNNIKETDLKTLNKHVSMVEGVVKFIGLASIIVGIITGVISLFRLI